jgi:pimeloyl-ACP methyl ester carboxylesterase
MVPSAHGKAYADAISAAGDVEIIAGAGHGVHVEKPDETVELILRLLKKH